MDTVTRKCDECGSYFEVDEGIALAMDAFAEQAGDPYVCSSCLPSDPYDDLDDLDGTHQSWLCEHCGDPAYDCGCEDDDEIPAELEDAFDARAERFPNGADPLTERKE